MIEIKAFALKSGESFCARWLEAQLPIRGEPTGRRGLLAAFVGPKSRSVPAFRPPWSIDGTRFADRCTGCGDCIAACPPGILHKAEDGKAALRFAAGGCDFCGKCAQVCKEGCFEREAARRPLELVARVGTSCLELTGVSCRLCEDTCAPSALRARPVAGGRRVVLLDLNACTGCGTCVSVCPSRAIDIVARPPAQQEIHA